MSALPDGECLTAHKGIAVRGLGIGLCAKTSIRSRARLWLGGMPWREMERTFQSRLGSRTARCSLCLGRGTEAETSEEHEGSEWHERESKEEVTEEAPRELGASEGGEGS